jgi:hypothetical protein
MARRTKAVRVRVRVRVGRWMCMARDPTRIHLLCLAHAAAVSLARPLARPPRSNSHGRIKRTPRWPRRLFIRILLYYIYTPLGFSFVCSLSLRPLLFFCPPTLLDLVICSDYSVCYLYQPLASSRATVQLSFFSSPPPPRPSKGTTFYSINSTRSLSRCLGETLFHLFQQPSTTRSLSASFRSRLQGTWSSTSPVK